MDASLAIIIERSEKPILLQVGERQNDPQLYINERASLTCPQSPPYGFAIKVRQFGIPHFPYLKNYL